jgi:hypothetical protein
MMIRLHSLPVMDVILVIVMQELSLVQKIHVEIVRQIQIVKQDFTAPKNVLLLLVYVLNVTPIVKHKTPQFVVATVKLIPMNIPQLMQRYPQEVMEHVQFVILLVTLINSVVPVVTDPFVLMVCIFQ